MKVNVQILIPTYSIFDELSVVNTEAVLEEDGCLYISPTDAACKYSEEELRERLDEEDSLDLIEEYEYEFIPALKIPVDDLRVSKVGIHGKPFYQFILDDEMKAEYRVDNPQEDICC